MEPNHKHYRAIWRNPKILSASYTSNVKFPSTESLKETMERVIPYWDNYIVPNIQRGQRILIVAHGTVLRSLIKYLDGKYLILILYDVIITFLTYFKNRGIR